LILAAKITIFFVLFGFSPTYLYLCAVEWQIVHLDETDSTNHWLREHGEGDMVVVADYQTAGRGCGTNRWESERGRNLLFSMLFHPTQLSAASQFFISQAVSVALCETLEQYIDRRVEIKWPNDIYVDDRKICGILIENRLQGSVIRDSIIGIGLNVNQRVFVSDAPNPVSLYQLTGQETDSLQLLDRFLLAFDSAFNSKTTCFTYKERLFRRGKDSLYKGKTTCFTARLMDVLPDGRLLLVDHEGKERLYAFKEVQFVI
jgi:BirA family biotin operon repressor/biotin-[acetyl-CoA-carboxylase] ligase